MLTYLEHLFRLLLLSIAKRNHMTEVDERILAENWTELIIISYTLRSPPK